MIKPLIPETENFTLFPVMGINVNENEKAYAHMIADSFKIFETRNTPSLRPYLGKTVAIIATHKNRKAEIIAIVDIKAEYTFTDSTEFYNCEWLHFISESSLYKFDKIKYCYLIGNVRKLEKPIPCTTKGIVARQVKKDLESVISC